MTRFIKTAEVAKMLNIAVNTVYKWCDEGRIPYVNHGTRRKRCLRFRLDAIEELVAARESTAADEKAGRVLKPRR